jgi:hypothetical protein
VREWPPSYSVTTTPRPHQRCFRIYTHPDDMGRGSQASLQLYLDLTIAQRCPLKVNGCFGDTCRLQRTARCYALEHSTLHYTWMFITSQRVLSVVYKTQNHWVLWLCPSPGTLKTRKHNVSEDRPVSFHRWEKETTSGSPLSAMRSPAAGFQIRFPRLRVF